MTQPGLNILQTDTVGKQQAGAAVPQIVEPNPTHVVLLQKFGQLLCQIVRLHQLTQFIDIDIVQIIRAVTVAAKLAV